MYKRSLDEDTVDGLYALLGAGLGGAGGYGLYRLISNPKTRNTPLAISAALLGAAAGGNIGWQSSKEYRRVKSKMLAEGLKKQEEIAKNVQDQIDSLSSNP